MQANYLILNSKFSLTAYVLIMFIVQDLILNILF